MAIVDLEHGMRPMEGRMQSALDRSTRGMASGTRLWILVPPELQQVIVAQDRERVQRMLHSLAPGNARRNPLLGMANMAATVIGVYAAAGVFGFLVILSVATGAAGAEGAAAAGVTISATEATAGTGGIVSGAAEATAGTGGAEVIALRTAAAASETQTLSQAAGVMFPVATVEVHVAPGGLAGGSRATGAVRRVSAIRAVPEGTVGPAGDYRQGRTVLFQGQRYIVVGRAIVG